ncbi:hypothetical protein MWT96_07310 [Prescottella equi]|uniref:Uncharacterized protein n=2 Tax=Rhodococcus hoagii TaxID=43767 RepID=E9T4Z5_RHOHA|nr:hypothetical protein [Prescottella equi]EGD22750.1 hypothetical protein HMPREF0724_13623 [Prescottella equi ATCC 33707]MBM4481295.1 hypothetical protein [Prescottella equi]MBM4487250.1 hypothetical protein [Prescottella equi]MBM4495804.1 hypothetical protein [Prescottella equi]MBM4500560.1 hypothetical protein [Prescottella equi]
MSVVATPSVHALLRDLVANCTRSHFLDDPEGLELSNQAALMREVVVTVQACLAPDLDATRAAERRDAASDPHWSDSPGLRLIAAIAQYEEILSTLLDAAALVESGRMSTAWTLLGSTADRLRVLAALASAAGDDVARQLAATSAHARARFTAAAATDGVDLGLPAPFESATNVVTAPAPLALGEPPRAIARVIELATLGAATSRDGGPLDTTSLHGSPHHTDYAHLATVGGYQFHLVLDIVRAATDSLCSVAGALTAEQVWADWADDVREAIEFAWDCI